MGFPGLQLTPRKSAFIQIVKLKAFHCKNIFFYWKCYKVYCFNKNDTFSLKINLILNNSLNAENGVTILGLILGVPILINFMYLYLISGTDLLYIVFQ